MKLSVKKPRHGPPPGGSRLPPNRKKALGKRPSQDGLSLLREEWIANSRDIEAVPAELISQMREHLQARISVLNETLPRVPALSQNRIRVQLRYLQSWLTEIPT